jgi:hypothetical protein
VLDVRLAVCDVGVHFGPVGGAEVGRLAKVLFESIQRLFPTVVLLVTPALVEHENHVLGLDEEVTQDVDPLLHVPGNAGLSCRFLLGLPPIGFALRGCCGSNPDKQEYPQLGYVFHVNRTSSPANGRILRQAARIAKANTTVEPTTLAVRNPLAAIEPGVGWSR